MIEAINKKGKGVITEFSEKVWDMMPPHKNGWQVYGGEPDHANIPSEIKEFQQTFQKKKDVTATQVGEQLGLTEAEADKLVLRAQKLNISLDDAMNILTQYSQGLLVYAEPTKPTPNPAMEIEIIEVDLPEVVLEEKTLTIEDMRTQLGSKGIKYDSRLGYGKLKKLLDDSN